MDLTSLTKPLTKPPQITIVAAPGAGKTTLGALFPNPIFIQAENGTATFETWEEKDKPTVFPLLPSPENDKTPTPDYKNTKKEVFKSRMKISPHAIIMDQLRSLATQDHNFKSLVFDTVTSMSTTFEREVCEMYGVESAGDAAGGFQKGFEVVREMHTEVKSACDYLREKKDMAIIFLAHLGIQKIKNSPESDEYSMYSLGMHQVSIPVYVNLVDAVLYLRQDAFVTGGATDRKGVTTKLNKIIQTGDRSLITCSDGHKGYVSAKNRYDLDSEIPVPIGTNPLLDLIPYFARKL
jgi:hypothetical protein